MRFERGSRIRSGSCLPKTLLKTAAVAALLLVLAQGNAEQPVRIAIIIDDLGYQLNAGRRAIELPGPVACAILPGTPRGEYLAEAANENGKEVLLHLPLQAVGSHDPVERLGITLDMSHADFSDTFAAAMASVPFAIGVNSHRGSLLTRHPGHMRWLMDDIRERRNLFFIDSYTTHESVAMQVAAEAGVQALKRDVFLDADPAPESVRREFERLKSLARERGSAVGIGHPYAATFDLLERELEALADEGIELVPLSELIESAYSGRQEAVIQVLGATDVR